MGRTPATSAPPPLSSQNRIASTRSVIHYPPSITLGTQTGDKSVDSTAKLGDGQGITGGCHSAFISLSQARHLLSANSSHRPVDSVARADLGEWQISTVSTSPTTTTKLQILGNPQRHLSPGHRPQRTKH